METTLKTNLCTLYIQKQVHPIVTAYLLKAGTNIPLEGEPLLFTQTIEREQFSMHDLCMTF